jgi:transposase-like protein
VSPSTVSNLNKKIYAKIEAWRNRRIEGEHPYLYLDGIVMKRTWAGEARNVSLHNQEDIGIIWLPINP